MKRKIAPSLLAADFTKLDRQLAELCSAGMEVLHLDIMDGHFVPNISFGPDVVRQIRPLCPGVCFDVHLMLSHPFEYVDKFAAAGADMITIHAECKDDIEATLRRINSAGKVAGLSVKPATSVREIERYKGLFGLCLVMTVEPGFGGQTMKVSCLEKLPELRERFGDELMLSVDGGVDAENVLLPVRAGADILVAGSAVFKGGELAANFKELTRAVTE